MNAKVRYEYWLDKLPEDSPMRKELEDIRGNEAEITDRFYQEIAFGTAGLRGVCGAGDNRMNVYTVGRATQGIADYINASQEDRDAGVVIGYDCRYHSQEFSELAAEILAGNGIKVYLFPAMRPTPELAFAIRRLHALSGINMTASHNPKEYNGYKVYWKDGAQISGAISDGMQACITRLDLFDPVRKIPLADAVAQGLVTMLEDGLEAMPAQGIDMDRQYLDYVAGMRLRPDEELDLGVPVVYTPLNGAGSIPMRQAAAERHFANFRLVPEQQEPDPEFATVGYPNPEDPKAFALAEKLGRETGAELLIATDPDSDRMAVEIPDGRGGYLPLNGNQTGALLIYYRAMSEKEKGTLPDKACMIKSIVTGDFGRAICEDYGIDVYEALTGFKNICGRIPELTERGYTYFFGYEESIGCAPGEAVRDKDGIAAGMLISEMAAYYRKRGKTIADVLEELYQRYGYYAEKQVSFVLKGQEGAARIARVMDAFRKIANECRAGGTYDFAGAGDHDATAEDESLHFEVTRAIDFADGYQDIPASNVLKYILGDGTWFAVRPSGTEPKIKFYYYTRTGSRHQSQEIIDRLSAAVSALAESVQ
jgi:phosphoglucomutase